MNEIEVPLFPKQSEFLSHTEREGLLESGIGFGKTFTGCLWLYMMTQEYPGSRWLLVARDVPQLRNAAIFEFKQLLNMRFQFTEGVHYKHTSSPNEFNFPNGSKIVCVGATNYDSAFRGPSYSGGLLDEVDYYKKEAYLALKGRIRIAPERIRLTSSPKGFNFVWEDFHQNLDETRFRINAASAICWFPEPSQDYS